MRRHLENRIELLASCESTLKAWGCGLNEARRNRKTARTIAKVLAGLDSRTHYDIGHSDCRPPPPASSLSVIKAYPLSVEAMLRRSI